LIYLHTWVLTTMTVPLIKKASGNTPEVATWVAEVSFQEAPGSNNMAALLVHISSKPYHFGTFDMGGGKFMVVIHSKESRTTNANCKITLSRMFKNAKIEAEIHQLAALNGYHLELFGLCPVPAAPDTKAAPDNDLSPKEQEELGEMYSTATSRQDLDEIASHYFAKRDQQALALKQEPTKATRPPNELVWLTDPPAELEVVTKRSLREWQKLVWVLFRDERMFGEKSMRTSPSVRHWDTFLKLYDQISPVGEARNRKREAFKTFSGHVLEVTGQKISLGDLPKATADKFIRDGWCYTCDKDIPIVGEMDQGIYTNVGTVVCRGVFDEKTVQDEAPFGIFCSRRCSSGRCLGCGGELVENKCLSNWCLHDQGRNKRKALPLGSGEEDYNEYIGEVASKYAQQGLALDWPFCVAKKQCMFHTCDHVCTRNCTHECTAKCRMHKLVRLTEQISYGHELCSCNPEWFDGLEDQIDPAYKRRRCE
jgi:hypothetical protein